MRLEDPVRIARVSVVLAQTAADLARIGAANRLGFDGDRLRRLHRRSGRRLRRNLTALRGVYIKVGQFLSLRNDVFSRSFCDALAELQDSVPPVPFRKIRPRIERELGRIEDVFSAFDTEPVAAASLGQVYFARLRDHAPVAVKVRYPGIRRIVDADLRNIQRLSLFLRPWTGRIPVGEMLGELRKGLNEELDYHREADNLSLFREKFSADEDVVIPRVISSHSTGAVLTMEWLDGIRLTEADQLAEHGISGRDAALLVVRFYAKQIMDFGVFHADPHPGNFLILPGPRLGVVDFGLVRELRPEQVLGMRELGLGFVASDPSLVARSFNNMGFWSESSGHKGLLPFARLFLQAAERMLHAGRREVRLGRLFAELGDLSRQHAEFRIPTEILLLGRVLSLLSGLGRKLRAGLRVDTVLLKELQRMEAR